jgi:hypothetical protein
MATGSARCHAGQDKVILNNRRELSRTRHPARWRRWWLKKR